LDVICVHNFVRMDILVLKAYKIIGGNLCLACEFVFFLQRLGAGHVIIRNNRNCIWEAPLFV